MPYDPVESHLKIEKLVVRGEGEYQERRYYRFRTDRWYGGIVTADCVGCGLFCKFCWVSDRVRSNPVKVGRFYTAKDVAERLRPLMMKKRLWRARVSGGEPTIGKDHLLNLLKILDGIVEEFILETNGILIGWDEDYAKKLASYKSLHVRVSLKGCNEREFELLTGADQKGFKLQLQALKNLIDYGVSCHPSVMTSFSPKSSLMSLLERLKQIDPILKEEVEVEELILYPHVVRRLKKYRLKY
ncbi:MAG TPA: radical SAM protein, partial [Nitrososphaeria archaeon]|nr:radical SAM protein [Nitrososphaeria archaeon]